MQNCPRFVSSGIASTLLPEDRTGNVAFNIPLSRYTNGNPQIQNIYGMTEVIRQSQLILF